MILSRVPADQAFGPVWVQVRDRIEAIRAASNEPALAEHIFYEIMEARAHLWTTADLRGFVVLQVLPSPYATDLHVWMAWNEAGHAGDFMEQLKVIAADNGCTSLTFASNRAGWLRRFPEAQVMRTFRIPVGG
jgi:hypothetical protein